MMISAQEIQSCRNDYSIVFGDKYAEATSFVKNSPEIGLMATANGIDPVFAISIIFPELIRYSAIRDMAEIQSLKVLYVQFGESYADFSIGPFQMKPSFAEKIEEDFAGLSGFSYFNDLNDFKYLNDIITVGFKPNPGDDPVQARKARIDRLTDINWQIKYLLMFIKVMEKKALPEYLSDMPLKLKYFATAYNCGYRKTPETILGEMNKKRFHTGLWDSPEKYNYSDISYYYYQKSHPPAIH